VAHLPFSEGPSLKRGAQDDRFGFELSMTDLKEFDVSEGRPQIACGTAVLEFTWT
jgi:hypothetical protein